MSDEDRTLLAEIIRQEHQTAYPTMKKDTYFELFTAEQILKSRSYDLDQDQIKSGNILVVGKGDRDGGVDSFYVFVNRRLVREDTDLTQYKGQKIDIDVVVIQSKNSNGFTETAFDKFSNFVDNVLRMSAVPSPESLTLYGQALRDAVGRFHTIFKTALVTRPTVKILFYYATLGEQIHGAIQARQTMLQKKVQDAFSTAEVPPCELLGAKSLLQLFYTRATQTFALESKTFITHGTSYICLVRLGEFFKFIDDNGAPRGSLFEANVRDYAGDVSVNRQIAATLRSDEAEFWWLNNGVTLIVSDVSSQGDTFTVTDPLIVNGLQTSYELHNHFRVATSRDDRRSILVRIVKTVDPASIDKIIKATNSQTHIPAAWLHATEDIHRKIETTLKGVGLYYDRRKNHYRNAGIEPQKIVTIPYLSQAMAAIVLQRPDDARARPTTVAERHYKNLFPEGGPTDIYARCAQILKRVDRFLDSQDMERGDRLNLSFYLAMYATCIALKSAKPQRPRLANFDLELLTDDFLLKHFVALRAHYLALGGDDRAAKGPDLVTAVKSELASRFSAAKRPKKIVTQ